MKNTILIAVMLIAGFQLRAQDWGYGGNNGVNPNLHMLGTTDNTPIPFRTSNIQRMRLYPNQNQFINQNQFQTNVGGRLMLSAVPAYLDTEVPQSLLHLAGPSSGGFGNIEFSWRPWMEYGLTMTNNGDVFWLGLKRLPGELDLSEAVINWGDNAVDNNFLQGPDDLVFRFTANLQNGAPNDWSRNSMDGMQIMRLTSLNSGRVGIGNFFGSQAVNTPKAKLHIDDGQISDQLNPQLRLSYHPEQRFVDFRTTINGDLSINPRLFEENRNVGINTFTPTETLDVVGNARFRGVESTAADALITGFEESSPGDYSLRYTEFTGNTNEYLNGNGEFTEIDTDDCDWQTDGNNVWTGVANNPDCYPNSNVGIGTSNPNLAKLDIFHPQSLFGGPTRGIHLRMTSGTEEGDSAEGIVVLLNSGAQTSPLLLTGQSISVGDIGAPPFISVGSIASASAVVRSVGVIGIGTSGSTSRVGVRGEANGVCGIFTAGIHGINQGFSCPPTIAQTNWAGYFDGDVGISGVQTFTSDANLKNDIAEFADALEVVMQLQPSTYTFKTEEYPELQLSNRDQIGFIAQEVEEILPHLVINTISPPTFDDDMNIVSEGMEIKMMNYNGIIPINTAAIKEQQTIISEQQAQIDQLAEMVVTLTNAVNACCETDINPKSGSGINNDIQLEKKASSLDQNIPNPFANETVISYTLAQSGKAVISIYNQAGQLVATLQDAQQEVGSYSLNWNAQGLAPGIYFYSLNIDGVEMVKRAVKL